MSDGSEATAPPPAVVNGVVLEVWVEMEIKDGYRPIMQKLFAAKMPLPHAHGQWLVCDFFVHDKSRNPTFTGFQKIFRQKYKPTKFKFKQIITINSDNGTDSDDEWWLHCKNVLKEMCHADVHVERAKAKSPNKRRK